MNQETYDKAINLLEEIQNNIRVINNKIFKYNTC